MSCLLVRFFQKQTPGVGRSLSSIVAGWSTHAEGMIDTLSGAYGCGFCEQPGKNLRTTNGGNVRIFPYQKESPKGELRTAAACVKYAEDAVRTNSVVGTEMCLLQLYAIIIVSFVVLVHMHELLCCTM